MEFNTDDSVSRRVKILTERISKGKEDDMYFYNQPIEELARRRKGFGARPRNGHVRLVRLSGTARSPAHQRSRPQAIDKFAPARTASERWPVR